ncbi:glycosyltransferase family 4 protein [Flavobacterium sp. WC2509]|uniref:glycosyltransferase family 4 protein n=1 Tax=Flavobacterium sp. WC2509 TaxID=3461406 RepID=UPI0040445D0C
MIKIAIVCNYALNPNRIGGMDYFYWELDKQLKLRNYEILWLFQNGGRQEHYQEKNLNFDLVDKNTDFTKSMVSWLKDIKDLDLFIGIFMDYQSTTPRNIKKQLQIPCLFVDQMSRSYYGKTWLYRFKRKIKGLLFYNKIDKIIAISDFVKKSIIKESGFFWKNKIEVVYNGLPLDNFKIEEKVKVNSEVLSIFCIGHLIPEKGFQTVISACKNLEENNIPFYLTIAGDGVFKNELIAQAMRELSSDSFKFVGNITNQSHFFNQTDIVIIPSLWKEGFGYTVAEAMLMRKVVFGSNIGAIPEVLGNENILFQAGNSSQLVELIKDYYFNKEKYNFIAEELYQRAINNFSLNKMVEEYIKIIENQLKK